MIIDTMKKLLLCVGSLVCIALEADWTPIQPISTGTRVADAFSLYNPSAGTWIALWRHEGSGFEHSYAAISTDHAQSWQTAQQLSNDTNNGLNLFGAYDSLHNTIVTLWPTSGGPGFSPIIGLYSVDGGSSWISIPTPPSGDVAADPFISYGDGELLVTWADYTTSGLYSSVSSDGGVTWGPTNHFDPSNTANENVYSAYNSTTRNFIAGWVDSSVSYFPLSSTSSDGVSWVSASPISNSIVANVDVSILYNATKNSTLATWVEYSSNIPYASTSTDGGTTWTPPMPISLTVTGLTDVFTAYDPTTGITMATWADQSNLAWYALSTDGGISWGSAAQISSAQAADNVSVAFDPVSQFFLATWSEIGSDFQPFYSRFFLEQLANQIASNQGGNVARLAHYLNSQAATQPKLITPLSSLSSKSLYSALVTILPKPSAALSAANSLMVLGNSLTGRGSERTLLRHIEATEVSVASLLDPDQLLAQNSDEMLPHGSTQTAARSKNKKYAFWVEGVKELACQNSQDELPSFHTHTGGGLIGFDVYQDNFQLSTAFSYARSKVKSSMEDDTINFYALALYSIGYIGDCFLEGGVWGVYNQYKQSRHIFFPGFDAYAISEHTGWQCAPHFRTGYDFSLRKNWILEPFGSADCAIVFQNGFSERGAAPYNMRQKSSTSELLQTSLGLNSYVFRDKSWGAWSLRLSAIYMYKKPFHLGNLIDEAIVGLPAGFSVIAYQPAQNLFAPSTEMLLRTNNGFFATLSYDGQFGSHYTSNSIYGKLGLFF